LAQCAEIVWQLRGEAGKRQVKDAAIGVSHNLGLGGACVVSVYKRPESWNLSVPKGNASPPKGRVSLGSGIPPNLAEEPSLRPQAKL
jgi:hypothetical protein